MSKTKTKEVADLDITNYTLEDLLTLFRLPLPYDEHDLKRAKSIVYKTHPDKSKLDPSYFLFYSKAYKIIYSLWKFKTQGNQFGKKEEREKELICLYSPDGGEGGLNKEKKEALHIYLQKQQLKPGSKQFHTWFNEQFEKNKILTAQEEHGYETWLRQKEEVNNEPSEVITNMAAMGEAFERKKEKMREVMIYTGIHDVFQGTTSSAMSMSLSNQTPCHYDSGLFSSLPYQDLQKAHEESIIPVSQQHDFAQKQHFPNVDSYLRYRQQTLATPFTEEESIQYLQEQERNQEEMSIRCAFDLVKQSELIQKKQDQFWKSIQLIKN